MLIKILGREDNVFLFTTNEEATHRDQKFYPMNKKVKTN